jgi:hypothetical protein
VALVLFALVSIATGCHRLDDDDLAGHFVFQRDSVKLEIQFNADHTFVETVTEAGVTRSATGAWTFESGSRTLNAFDVWVPSVPPGSERTTLARTAFGFHVDPCGSKLCLGVSDNDPPLEFTKE